MWCCDDFLGGPLHLRKVGQQDQAGTDGACCFTVTPLICSLAQINSVGVLLIVAGRSCWTYSGDGGPATAACLWDPLGLAVTSNADIYVADNANNAVRKVGWWRNH